MEFTVVKERVDQTDIQTNKSTKLDGYHLGIESSQTLLKLIVHTCLVFTNLKKIFIDLLSHIRRNIIN